jgi:hypothetical protein
MTMDPRRILEVVDRRNGVAVKRSLDWQLIARGGNNKERSGVRVIPNPGFGI